MPTDRPTPEQMERHYLAQRAALRVRLGMIADWLDAHPNVAVTQFSDSQINVSALSFHALYAGRTVSRSSGGGFYTLSIVDDGLRVQAIEDAPETVTQAVTL